MAKSSPTWHLSLSPSPPSALCTVPTSTLHLSPWPPIYQWSFLVSDTILSVFSSQYPSLTTTPLQFQNCPLLSPTSLPQLLVRVTSVVHCPLWDTAPTFLQSFTSKRNCLLLMEINKCYKDSPEVTIKTFENSNMWLVNKMLTESFIIYTWTNHM